MNVASRIVAFSKNSTTSTDVSLDELKSVSVSTKLNNGEPFVGKWEEAPEYLRDNEYIRKGYRINFNSVKRVAKSLFMLHNESMNVWSHLCGVILFLFLITYVAIWIRPRFIVPALDIIKAQINIYLGNGTTQDLIQA